jgi:hypothetical protein
MVLQRRRENEIIPKYSLTGDLLSYLRCGLQYRYHTGSSLPPSRPVQLWFGEFIHGVLERAFRIWRNGSPPTPFPWPCTPTPFRGAPPPGRALHDIGMIGDTVEASLRTQGKNPRSSAARDSAYLRAELAVNELGPHLFPLIAAAEERVIGTRQIPLPSGGQLASARARLYELHGIIDVVTNVEFTGVPDTNVFKRAIQEASHGLAGNFEVIVDYKGSRRPAITHPYWQQGEWQVQTYAWLRMRQPISLPVVAGVLTYINELAQTSEDLTDLKREIQRGETDIAPVPGTTDAYQLNAWRPGNAPPNFSFGFRAARAIRVVPVNAASQQLAASAFDQVVRQIENCVAAEAAAGRIIQHWNPSGDDDTCVACDFRHFCPNPAPRTGHHVVEAPNAP